MYEISCKIKNGIIETALSGRIDRTGASDFGARLDAVRGTPAKSAIVDCAGLEYISDEGLRILLTLKKEYPETRFINVSSGVYRILASAGFTDAGEVSKAYRTVSVGGCEAIGRGASSVVYRIDTDTIVKVYSYPDSLGDLLRERELARTAFLLGIPTAVPYDVVRIKEGGYGSVFELLDAKSFAELLADGEKSVDEIAKMSVDLLKRIHSTEAEPGTIPDMKNTVAGWVEYVGDVIPEKHREKLRALVAAVPPTRRLIHGDYHVKNVMMRKGEVFLIDMDTLSCGDPVFELGCICSAYRGYGEVDHGETRAFLGIGYETAEELWKRIVFRYMDGDEERIKAAEDKAVILSSVRVLRHVKRYKDVTSGEGKALLDACVRHFEELLPKVGSLAL
ncbi:MAG: phosphotransferase [Clostridia bacterium]|nr:phosphotransferase [Clostridia bacterium]